MEAIEKANALVVERILTSDPILIDVQTARDVVPGLKDGMILHAGPPIEWDRMCGPMKGAITGIAVYEGWASDLADAEAKAAAGAFEFHPNHHFDCVGPMTGMTK